MDLTDEQIAHLLSQPKIVENPRARGKKEMGMRRLNYDVQGDGGNRFSLYVRENLRDKTDYSCGLLWHRKGAKSVTLCRYNGSSHIHGLIHFATHIHKATAEAFKLGKQPEYFATETARYKDCDGALNCLTYDCNITGLDPDNEHQTEMLL